LCSPELLGPDIFERFKAGEYKGLTEPLRMNFFKKLLNIGGGFGITGAQNHWNFCPKIHALKRLGMILV
jgi:hypothetical protein